MSNSIIVSVGRYSNKGRKPENQDFNGFHIAQGGLLESKGIALAMADGISSSPVSREASEAAVNGFLADYYSTPDAWSVKTSAHRVLAAINSWLHAQTRQSQYRFNRDKGFVCTFSALVIKARSAHLFHVGDARIYRLQDGAIEQLTEDHRLFVSSQESYLSKALGVHNHLELDYRALTLHADDLFILTTDGIHEYVSEKQFADLIAVHANDLNQAAHAIVEKAYAQGSPDNLTVQLLRVERLPEGSADDAIRQPDELPFPPALRARMHFDGFEIRRELYFSSRSHVYLAEDSETRQPVVIKIPAVDKREDGAFLERFLLEEWIARRIDNAHVLKAVASARKRRYLYTVMEYIEGQTLTQWMIDHPAPELETVRQILEQIVKGLRALHRKEMLHQDLRPDNIMIDHRGTVKIIDFGATRVAGLVEADLRSRSVEILGTTQYSAPEYFIGERVSARSDQFSLAVIAYQMLSGRLPYGIELAKARTRSAQHKLKYRSVLDDQRNIPLWVDAALKKALHPNPYMRYQALSEFLLDLRQPNPVFVQKTQPPLMERNPVAFWKGVSALLAMLVLMLLFKQHAGQ